MKVNTRLLGAVLVIGAVISAVRAPGSSEAHAVLTQIATAEPAQSPLPQKTEEHVESAGKPSDVKRAAASPKAGEVDTPPSAGSGRASGHRRKRRRHGKKHAIRKRPAHRRRHKHPAQPVTVEAPLSYSTRSSASSRPTGPGPTPPRVNIQTATVAEWGRLPGVTPLLAARIVAVRDMGGGFDGVEDLLDVAGVTEAQVQRWAPYLQAP